jgi:hypothetical protein
VLEVAEDVEVGVSAVMGTVYLMLASKTKYRTYHLIRTDRTIIKSSIRLICLPMLSVLRE